MSSIKIRHSYQNYLRSRIEKLTMHNSIMSMILDKRRWEDAEILPDECDCLLVYVCCVCLCVCVYACVYVNDYLQYLIVSVYSPIPECTVVSIMDVLKHDNVNKVCYSKCLSYVVLLRIYKKSYTENSKRNYWSFRYDKDALTSL